jgi:hypothetical protein
MARHPLSEFLFRAFYAPTVLWVEHPTLTIVPPILFGLLWLRSKRRGRPSLALAVAAVLWTAYCLYELVLFAWRPEEMAIRIDLIVLGPFMYAVTALGLAGWVRTRGNV